MNLRLRSWPIVFLSLLGHDHWFATTMILCILGVIGLRVVNLNYKSSIGHDESWSYLSVTCQLEDFRLVAASSEPTPVSEWKRFLQIERPFCFSEISDGLARFDIHPPFYFWLLHLWSLVFGIGPAIGPVLNIFFAAATSFILYKLAAATLKNRLEVMLVIVTYAFGYGTIRMSLEARQYDLMALLTVLFVWQLILLMQPEKRVKWYRWVFLATAVTIGGLTHHHFIIVFTAGIVFAVFRLVNSNPSRLLRIFFVSTLGYALAFLIFPLHTVALRQQAHVAVDASPYEFIGRLMIIGLSFYQYLHIQIAVFILMSVMLVLLLTGRQKSLMNWYHATDFSGSSILFFFFWIAGWTILLYLTLRSPRHAMSEKYLIMAWPFFAFLPVFLLRLFRFRASLTLYFFLVPIVFAVMIPWNSAMVGDIGGADKLARHDIVLIDNKEPGILPQIIRKLPDEQLVVIGDQAFLIENAESWLKYLTSESIYISELSHGDNTVEKRNELLALMEGVGLEPRLVTQVSIDGEHQNYAPLISFSSRE